MEQEILKILADKTNPGDRLNEVVDQFRRGRDVNDLVVLLDSNDAELASIGAWIPGELPFDLYRSEPFVARLRGLTDHPDPAVRFHAFGALFPILNSERDSSVESTGFTFSSHPDGPTQKESQCLSELTGKNGKNRATKWRGDLRVFFPPLRRATPCCRDGF